MKRRGFTLVELMLALMIISVLAAMLFPVFARGRESARKTQCLSNLANLGAALQMYAADWQGALPPQDNQWGPVDDYVKNRDVLHCPMDPRLVEATGGTGSPVVVSYSSYIYRAGLHNDGLATEVTAFDRQIWHMGGRNVVFLDGHAKWWSPVPFWSNVSARVLSLDPAYQKLTPAEQKEARAGTLQRRSWE